MPRRVARDARVHILFNTADGEGVDQNFGGQPTEITGIVKEITIRQSGQMVDVSGLSDAYPRKRVGQYEHTITLNHFWTENSLPWQPSSGSPVGYKVRVDVRPVSSLQTPYTFYGIISRWEWSTRAGDAQVQTIEIEATYDA